MANKVYREYKTCRICGETLHKDYFYRNHRSKDDLQPYCKDCSKQKAKEYQQDPAKIERIRESKRVWAKNNYHGMPVEQITPRKNTRKGYQKKKEGAF